MKQVLQNMKNGDTTLADVPVKKCGADEVLIETCATLISAGTERMLVEFGKANLINKARQQPEKVKQVIDKVKTDGLLTTLESVQSKLDQPLPLGYCNVGVVRQVGAKVTDIQLGDRVVSNGPHAEFVCAPKNLVAKIPGNVDDDNAVFTALGSIGLQGIRLAQPTLGESVVVSGLGLIGLLTVQLLKAQGCRVLGIDFDARRLELAEQIGAETFQLGDGQDPVAAGMAFSRGRGVDAVLITAATKSSDPVSQAANMCRKRGRIVLVGVTGLELNRSDFYEKELSFQVSCSYGPGRYDTDYERGQDYPFGFVRWTMQRNFEAILDSMASGQVKAEPLITHRYDFDQAVEAYDVLANDKSALGIVLRYEGEARKPKALAAGDNTISLQDEKGGSPRFSSASSGSAPVCGFIGAGNYGSRVLIPAFQKANAKLHTIVSSGGVSAAFHGRKAGFEQASTDIEAVIANDEINTVVIATRHDTHAKFAMQALNAGKHVFVEKPLAITVEELTAVSSQLAEPEKLQTDDGRLPTLFVGFNRRFAPLVVKMKSLIDKINEPKCFVMTMNAGAIPANTWIQDPSVGGGRIIGEACHLIDLMRFLAGHPIVSVDARRIGNVPTVEVAEDKATITLGFADGSMGTVHYFANGGKSFPKERFEVFAGDSVLQLNNFRKLQGFGVPGFKSMSSWKQDKGHAAGVAAFLNAIETGAPSPIPCDEILEVSRVAIQAAEQLRAQG